jgi:hypothetical protein
MTDPETIEMLPQLAAASGWSIPEARIHSIAAVYEAISQDTRLLRETDLKDLPIPAAFKAD